MILVTQVSHEAWLHLRSFVKQKGVLDAGPTTSREVASTTCSTTTEVTSGPAPELQSFAATSRPWSVSVQSTGERKTKLTFEVIVPLYNFASDTQEITLSDRTKITKYALENLKACLPAGRQCLGPEGPECLRYLDLFKPDYLLRGTFQGSGTMGGRGADDVPEISFSIAFPSSTSTSEILPRWDPVGRLVTVLRLFKSSELRSGMEYVIALKPDRTTWSEMRFYRGGLHLGSLEGWKSASPYVLQPAEIPVFEIFRQRIDPVLARLQDNRL